MAEKQKWESLTSLKITLSKMIKKINGESLCQKYLWHFLPKNPKACRGVMKERTEGWLDVRIG